LARIIARRHHALQVFRLLVSLSPCLLVCLCAPGSASTTKPSGPHSGPDNSAPAPRAPGVPSPCLPVSLSACAAPGSASTTKPSGPHSGQAESAPAPRAPGVPSPCLPLSVSAYAAPAQHLQRSPLDPPLPMTNSGGVDRTTPSPLRGEGRERAGVRGNRWQEITLGGNHLPPAERAGKARCQGKTSNLPLPSGERAGVRGNNKPPLRAEGLRAPGRGQKFDRDHGSRSRKTPAPSRDGSGFDPERVAQDSPGQAMRSRAPPWVRRPPQCLERCKRSRAFAPYRRPFQRQSQ
jgi:hypothetical protein